MKILITLLSVLLISTSTHAQMWRVLSTTESDDIHTKHKAWDSTFYFYSKQTNRGSDKKATVINYDSSINYNVSISPINGKMITVREKKYKLYNSHDNLIEYRFKVDVTLWENSTYTYDNANRVMQHKVLGRVYIQQQSQYVFGNLRNTNYTYNANGDISSYHHEVFNLSVVPNTHTSDTTYFTYDSNHVLISDSTVSKIAGTNNYSLSRKKTYHYTNGLLTKQIEYSWTGTQFDTSLIHDIKYDSLNRFVSDTVRKNNNDLHMVRLSRYYDNVSHKTQIDSIIQYPQVGFINAENTYVFRNDGYITLKTEQICDSDWNAISSITTSYNYEMYWPNSIASTSKKGMDIQLYPNPAVGVINITVELRQLEQLNCTISDMQGRTLLHWTDKADGQYRKQVPIHTLPSGIYMLNIDGETVQATKQFVVR